MNKNEIVSENKCILILQKNHKCIKHKENLNRDIMQKFKYLPKNNSVSDDTIHQMSLLLYNSNN